MCTHVYVNTHCTYTHITLRTSCLSTCMWVGGSDSFSCCAALQIRLPLIASRRPGVIRTVCDLPACPLAVFLQVLFSFLNLISALIPSCYLSSLLYTMVRLSPEYGTYISSVFTTPTRFCSAQVHSRYCFVNFMEK